ncbi:putative cysteine-rich receptor-like protein kinase 32 isoform X2 [Cryptomeria japonica]|uniref:putative cysteine-rich receptor-like protein kinase 32 isoform X2 n=1 Tax=Cryptomeria japonica TaxID=3369 RepID=UPI0027DA3AA7|nr:putative cysteine-rich receptor-like protein kinase 32 isoform X2 [Cryptomeria japonica]
MNIRRPTTCFFFLCIIIVFSNTHLRPCKAAKSVCNGAHYTNGSKVERNINTVVNHLVQHTSSSGGFNTTVEGQDQDQIFGLLQCRGDTTGKECEACSMEANRTIRQQCGNSLGGRVWLEKCYLRFEHNNFLGDLDTTSYLVQSNLLNSTDPEAFGSAVKALMSDLSVEVTASSNLYSSNWSGDDSSSTKIYGLVQCWRDISVEGCASCLDNAIRNLVEVTNGAHNLGGVVYSGSCTARYDTYPFFTLSSNGQNTSPSKKSSNKIPIIGGSLGGFLILVLLGGMFAARRKLKSAISGKSTTPNRDAQRSKELDWQKRLNIITGVSRGLLYLHEDSQLRIIHRDIKASNILLDEEMNPKIADFGLAKLFPKSQTHISTRVAGTYGYLAPEYAMHGKLSSKADVYSFGVVLLEVVSGRKNNNTKLATEDQNLLSLAWRCYSRGNSLDVIDKEIIDKCPKEQCIRCIHVGLLCTQADASLRPPMSIVYSMLSNTSFTNLPNPTKPAFVNVTHGVTGGDLSHGSRVINSISISSSSAPSVNDASVTELRAR